MKKWEEMTMAQKRHSKAFRKALRLIKGGREASDACRKNIVDAWLAIIGARNVANDNGVRS